MNLSYKLLWWEKNQPWEVDDIKNKFIDSVCCSHLTLSIQLIGYLYCIISCTLIIHHIKPASHSLMSIMPNKNMITGVFYSSIAIGNNNQDRVHWN